MSGNELVEWMAFERLEPFGPLADESRAGQVCATVANVQRKAETKPFYSSDFMPALRRAIEGEKVAAVAPVITDAQHADLIDAELFGVARKRP